MQDTGVVADAANASATKSAKQLRLSIGVPTTPCSKAPSDSHLTAFQTPVVIFSLHMPYLPTGQNKSSPLGRFSQSARYSQVFGEMTPSSEQCWITWRQRISRRTCRWDGLRRLGTSQHLLKVSWPSRTKIRSNCFRNRPRLARDARNELVQAESLNRDIGSSA